MLAARLNDGQGFRQYFNGLEIFVPLVDVANLLSLTWEVLDFFEIRIVVLTVENEEELTCLTYDDYVYLSRCLDKTPVETKGNQTDDLETLYDL